MAKQRKNLNPLALKGLLYNRKLIIALSILLSFVLWLVITTQENTTLSRVFKDMTVSVDIEGSAAENDMNVVGDLSDHKFTVTVNGPNYVVSSLDASDISLYVSAKGVSESGNYTLVVEAKRSSTNYNVSISPSTVTLEFDKYITKSFPIKAVAKGEVKAQDDGLTAEAGIVTGIQGDSLEITGPQKKINKIARVEAVYEVDHLLPATEIFDAEIQLYDENNEKISLKNIKFNNTDDIQVKVPISKIKSVPLVVDFINLPNGFDKSSIAYTARFNGVEYKTIDIIGEPEIIDSIKEIKLDPIDITKVSPNSNTFNLSIKLPEGVRLIDNTIEAFDVNVRTTGYTVKTVSVSAINSINLKPGLKSTQTRISAVTICVPTSIAYKVKNDTLSAQVDLSGMSEGSYNDVPVVFDVTKYNKIWVIGEYSTHVTISKK